MRNPAAGSQLLLGTLDVSKQLELFDERLVGGGVQEDGSTPAVLGQEDRTTVSLNLTHDSSDVRAELGE